ILSIGLFLQPPLLLPFLDLSRILGLGPLLRFLLQTLLLRCSTQSPLLCFGSRSLLGRLFRISVPSPLLCFGSRSLLRLSVRRPCLTDLLLDPFPGPGANEGCLLDLMRRCKAVLFDRASRPHCVRAIEDVRHSEGYVLFIGGILDSETAPEMCRFSACLGPFQ